MHVISMKGDGTPALVLKRGVLRHDLFSGSPPIDLPAGKPASYPHESEYSERAKDYTFVLPGGKAIEVQSLLETPPTLPRLNQPGREALMIAPLTYPRKIVVLHQAVELVEGDKVIRRWYKPLPAVVSFKPKPPLRAKRRK